MSSSSFQGYFGGLTRYVKHGTLKHMKDEYLTRKTVSLILQVNIRTVDRYIKHGLLKAIKIGGLVRITNSSLQKLLISGGTL